MCEYTSMQAAAEQTLMWLPRPLFSNKTHRRKKPVYIVHKVCQSTRPHAFSQSHLPIERHTSAHAHTRAQTHEEKGLFSLHVVMLVNLLTGTANRGNLPSCSCVLRETLETVEISLTLFSSWLWLQKQLGHSGMRRWGRVRCFSITLPHQSRSSPLKRAAGEKKKKQNLWYQNWTRSVEINTAAYMRGLH